MKICFIANANSIHARRWIEYFCRPENEIFVLSTVRNPEPMEGAEVYNLHSGKPMVPVSRFVDATRQKISKLLLEETPQNKATHFLIWAAKNVYGNAFVDRIRRLYRTFRLVGSARAIVKGLQPDLLHCLRLPIEGYIGGLVGYRPLVISSWGNDFVFYANKYLLLRWLTKRALKRADIHFADNIRDRYLAEIYGFSPLKMTAPVPGWGGLRLEESGSYRQHNVIRRKLGITPDMNLLISPRGFGSRFVNTEALIRALPQVVRMFSNILCLLIGDTRSPGYLRLKRLADKLELQQYCRFVNRLEHSEFLNYLAASDITISVSLYDGCSVSMLEGMACGAIPVVSNDFPKREWITDGWNGYLFNPRDPESIARAITKALENKGNFEIMRKRNWNILKEKADYHKNMKIAEGLYHKLVHTAPAEKSNRT